MTLLQTPLSSKKFDCMYKAPYKGSRHVYLNKDVEDVYYLKRSQKYLCLYKDYITLNNVKHNPYGIHSDTVWIKDVECVKKVIPLSLNTIICVFDTYINILDGLNCTEQLIYISCPIVNAFAYQNNNGGDIRLGVIWLNSNNVNRFRNYKLLNLSKKEDVEIQRLIPPYFFGYLNNNRILKFVESIDEPILCFGVVNDCTQLFTHNYVWLVGAIGCLNKYMNDYEHMNIWVYEGTMVLRKRLDDWLDA